MVTRCESPNTEGGGGGGGRERCVGKGAMEDPECQKRDFVKNKKNIYK